MRVSQTNTGWVGDKIGRKRGVFVGNFCGIVGAALMAGSQNSSMFICARIIAGLGIGFINAIIPPWVSELSEAHDRGSSFSLVFVANYLGIVIAYWINFGIRETAVEFRWRFPLAWMIIPLLVVCAALPFLPESPRYEEQHKSPTILESVLIFLIGGSLRTASEATPSISSANFVATCDPTMPRLWRRLSNSTPS